MIYCKFTYENEHKTTYENVHIRFTAIWKYIVSLSPFVSLSLMFKTFFLPLEIGIRCEDLHNENNTNVVLWKYIIDENCHYFTLFLSGNP